MSQEAVAVAMRDLGFSHIRQQTVDRLERGSQRPRLGEYLALASVLGVDPASLLRPEAATQAGLRIQKAVRDTRAAHRAMQQAAEDLARGRRHIQVAVTRAIEQGYEGDLADEMSLARVALRDTEEGA